MMSKKQWVFKYLEDYTGEGLASKLTDHVNDGWVIENVSTVVVSEEDIYRQTNHNYIKQVILLKRSNTTPSARRVTEFTSVQDDDKSDEVITQEEFLERLGEDDPLAELHNAFKALKMIEDHNFYQDGILTFEQAVERVMLAQETGTGGE
jgi:hypothetical protein